MIAPLRSLVPLVRYAPPGGGCIIGWGCAGTTVDRFANATLCF